jgi:hypothetical protein
MSQQFQYNSLYQSSYDCSILDRKDFVTFCFVLLVNNNRDGQECEARIGRERKEKGREKSKSAERGRKKA